MMSSSSSDASEQVNFEDIEGWLPESEGMNDQGPLDMEELKQKAQAADEEVKSHKEEKQQREPLPGKAGICDQILDALAKGDVNVRGGLGQAFSKWLRANPDKKAVYDKVGEEAGPGQKTEAKKQWRMDWAAATYEESSVAVKRKLEEYKNIDESIGRYCAIEVVAKKEGGSATSWVAAANYARKCAELGGKWITYNSWTKRVEVLYVRSQYRTVFTNAWQLLTEAKESTGSKDAPTVPDRKQEREDIEPQPAATRLEVKRELTEPKSDETSARQLNTLMRRCQTLKGYILVARGVQTSLFGNIKDDASWSFATCMVEQLQSLMQAANQAHDKQKEFANMFLNLEVSLLKKRFDTSTLHKNLAEFEKNMKDPIAKLKEFQEKLNNMHTMFTK
jgi:hypothetical protein